MRSTLEQKAIDGLVELWADIFCNEIYFVQGKAFTTYQLKPYVKAALAEPDSATLCHIQSPRAGAYVTYASLPIELRAIVLALTEKDVEDGLYFFKRLFYGFAVLHSTLGITAAEAEWRLEQSFKRDLSHVTLKELRDKPDKSNLHTWLEALPLFPGSIAGADRHLKTVLMSRYRTVSGDERVCPEVTYYEQDAKTALWECWKGKHVDEAMKMLSKQGDPTERMATLQRIMDGQEPELLRTMMLSMLRKTIEDLPDISEQLQEKRRTYDRAKKIEAEERRLQGTNAVRDTLLSPVRMIEEVLATVPSKHDDLVEPTPADLLKQIGISRDNTSEAEWQVFMMFSQKILDGELEVGSKTGLSISAALGKDAPRVRKIISRYRERQLNL